MLIYTFKLPYNTNAEMRKKVNCEECQHMHPFTIHAHYETNPIGYRQFFPKTILYECTKTYGYIRKLKRYCPHYLSIHQTALTEVKQDMVKIEDIPNEGARWELKDLPHNLDLKATSEKIVAGQAGKAGGLQIDYVDKTGKSLTQKYTLVSGAVLGTALKKLKLTDTLDLQKAFYTYELTAMRIGKPRMIPVKKVE